MERPGDVKPQQENGQVGLEFPRRIERHGFSHSIRLWCVKKKHLSKHLRQQKTGTDYTP